MLVTISEFVQSYVFPSGADLFQRSYLKNELPGVKFSSSAAKTYTGVSASFDIELTKPRSKRRMVLAVTKQFKEEGETSYEETDFFKNCASKTAYRLYHFHESRATPCESKLGMECRVEVQVERGRIRSFNEKNRKLTDVVLVSGDAKKQEFHVSKAILAEQSPYFRKLFYETHPDQTIVELEELPSEILQDLLQVIYLVPTIYESNVENLLNAAEIYDFCLELVTEKCRKFLQTDNFLSNSENTRLSSLRRSMKVGEFRKTVDFSVPDPLLSDVVLIAGEEKQKFHVNKTILATHSSFFYAMFFSYHPESEQSEIELKLISPEVLQALLNIIYHAPTVHNDIVEELLEVARMYDIKPVTDECQKFLKTKSNLPKKMKKRLALEYDLAHFLQFF